MAETFLMPGNLMPGNLMPGNLLNIAIITECQRFVKQITGDFLPQGIAPLSVSLLTSACLTA